MLELGLLLLLAVGAGANTVTISNHWNGGFGGKACIDFTKEMSGWDVQLHFDHPVDQLDTWAADATKVGDGKVWNLHSKGWNAIEHVGDQVCLDFVAHVSGDISSPHVEIVVQGSGGTGHTSAPTHTSAPHHTNTPVVLPTAPHTGKGKYNYAEVLRLSILFYDAQRSGKLPANNPIPWRGDSALHDKGDNGEDLTGGWYDAGDNVKFNYPMAFTVTGLLWGMLEYEDGYVHAGQMDMALDMIRWPLDYLLKCWLPQKQELYVQVGDADIDHRYWDRPENMTMARPAFKVTASKPGSDVASDTAAAFAAGYMVFKKRDPAYAQKLLHAAESLYGFAVAHPGYYTKSTNIGSYSSDDYKDEMCMGGAMLYKATNNATYLHLAEGFVDDKWPWAYMWGEKRPGCHLLLYMTTRKQQYKALVDRYLNSWMPGSGFTYTPCGMAYRDKWGSLRLVMGTAMIAVMASLDPGWASNAADLQKWALGQANYALGDNNYCLSYVIGFGSKYPLRPHHRAASCPAMSIPCTYLNTDDPNPHVLLGAMVGGPTDQDHYVDSRGDYVLNEVAVDYNMGLTTTMAAFVHMELKGQLPQAPQPKCHCTQ